MSVAESAMVIVAFRGRVWAGDRGCRGGAGCLTVRAVWKSRLVLNGVMGVMDPGLGSVRQFGRVKGSESTVRIPCGIEPVRLLDRLLRGRAE